MRGCWGSDLIPGLGAVGLFSSVGLLMGCPEKSCALGKVQRQAQEIQTMDLKMPIGKSFMSKVICI